MLAFKLVYNIVILSFASCFTLSFVYISVFISMFVGFLLAFVVKSCVFCIELVLLCDSVV